MPSKASIRVSSRYTLTSKPTTGFSVTVYLRAFPLVPPYTAEAVRPPPVPVAFVPEPGMYTITSAAFLKASLMSSIDGLSSYTLYPSFAASESGDAFDSVINSFDGP